MYSGGKNSDKNFSKLFHVIIDLGIWAKLSFKAKGVYNVLLRYADYNTRIAKISIKLISEKSNVSIDGVSEATNELEVAGLISKKRAGPRLNFKNIYYLPKEDEIRSFVLRQIYEPYKGSCRKITGKCKTPKDSKTGRFVKGSCYTGEKHGDNSGKNPGNNNREKHGDILEIDIRDNNFRCYKKQLKTLTAEIVSKLEIENKGSNSK